MRNRVIYSQVTQKQFSEKKSGNLNWITLTLLLKCNYIVPTQLRRALRCSLHRLEHVLRTIDGTVQFVFSSQLPSGSALPKIWCVCVEGDRTSQFTGEVLAMPYPSQMHPDSEDEVYGYSMKYPLGSHKNVAKIHPVWPTPMSPHLWFPFFLLQKARIFQYRHLTVMPH